MSGCRSVHILRIGLTCVVASIALFAANLLHDARAQVLQVSRETPSTDPHNPFPMPPELVGVNLLGQSN
ncbi:MAG TPA: hypothetical protein VH120_11670, partial [Gemmataceae bacterium]|nr:hypothetical protein [Gemmataceae bacterium]